MTDLRSALEKYLSMRKGLGYKYEHQTRRLGDFIASLGEAIKPPTTNPINPSNPADPKAAKSPLGPGCSCRQAGAGKPQGAATLLAVMALLGVAVRRRNAKKWAMLPRHDSWPVRAAGSVPPPSS